jgi:SAM-dependent MidA family methyltransferase
MNNSAPAQNHAYSVTPLENYLLRTLGEGGRISFEQFMELCLYHPEIGYYTRGPERTGKRGDFFTSPDLHPIFARLVARQAAEMWELLGRPVPFAFVEMGAGRGLFAQDFLRWVSGVRPDFGAALEYMAVETGVAARARLSTRLTKAAEDPSIRRPWQVLGSLEEVSPVTGCCFSNELADAFPVAVVTRERGRLREIYVAAEQGRLVERTGPFREAVIAAWAARYAAKIEEGQRLEVNRAALQWIRSLARKIHRGFVLTVDYGGLAEHLVDACHHAGTLMAYCQHKAHDDLLARPGEQDLTAHVNFSELILAGKEAGLELTGFTTQERFLLALGEPNQFADLYDSGQSEVQKLDARLKLQRLINPEGMGTMFKVLIQHRGIAKPRLTGLALAR